MNPSKQSIVPIDSESAQKTVFWDPLSAAKKKSREKTESEEEDEAHKDLEDEEPLEEDKEPESEHEEEQKTEEEEEEAIHKVPSFNVLPDVVLIHAGF